MTNPPSGSTVEQAREKHEAAIDVFGRAYDGTQEKATAWARTIQTADALIAAVRAESEGEREKARLNISGLMKLVEESAQEIERLQANLKTLIQTEEAYRANERLAFERLSDALTGGSAGTWDEVFHAAEAELSRLK